MSLETAPPLESEAHLIGKPWQNPSQGYFWTFDLNRLPWSMTGTLSNPLEELFLFPVRMEAPANSIDRSYLSFYESVTSGTEFLFTLALILTRDLNWRSSQTLWGLPDWRPNSVDAKRSDLALKGQVQVSAS